MKKRIISTILALSMLLGTCSTVQAASTEAEALGEVDIYNGGYELSYLSMNGSTRTLIYTYYNYVNDDGVEKEIPAYCVNPNTVGVPQTVAEGESISYLAEEITSDAKIMGIIANGYPTRSLAELGLENKYQAYYATKMALWCYLLSNWDISNLTVAPGLTGDELERAETMLAATVDIYTRGTAWSEVLSPSLTTSVDRDVAYDVTIDGTAYKQQVFTITSETWVCDYDISVAFTMPDDVPEGTRIVDMDNNDITAITTSATGNGYAGQCKVIYPTSSIEGTEGNVQLSFSADVYAYAIYYAICAETDEYGTLQNYICDTDPTTPVRLSTYSTYGDEPDVEMDTGLTIIKYEAGTTIPLSGAIFEVVDPSGATVGTFATNSEGEINIPLTIVGNYTVIETQAPAYYTISETPAQNVTVVYGDVAQVVFENEPYGNLQINKYSDTGEKLSGAVVTITHIESGATYTGETDFSGAAIFENLQLGAYEIVEVLAPDGYEKDDTVYTTTVVTGETTSFSLVNNELPGLRITKYDRVNMVTMADVTFEIFKDTVSLGYYTTDQFGEILLTDLAPGTYKAVEVDTGDDDYILETTPQEVELVAGGGIKELVFFNDMKPSLLLIKVDGNNPSITIPNAVFEIESVAGDYGPVEFTTDVNGEIDLSQLPTGAYVVTELSCPGYVIDDAQRIIQLDANENAQFVFTNQEEPSMRIVKISSDGTPLAGVTFRIASIEDGTHYLDRITDSNGEILIENLDPGVYSVQETATTSDHILNDTEYHVQLFAGQTSEIVIENQQRSNLTVWKFDADTGAPIANTVFDISLADGESIDQIITGSDGSATIENLLPDVYEVTEVSVPSPYLLDAPSQLVTISANRDRSVYFENHQMPSLTINKICSITGNPLEGVKFHVTYASNNTGTGEINDLGYFYTDENGQISLTNVVDGWYTVEEVGTISGYALNETPQVAYVQSGTTKSMTFENTPLSAISVWKYDSVTGEAIEGATFEVQYLTGTTSGTGGTVIGTYQTGASGSFIVTNLEAGTYIITEIASDSDHVIDTAPQTVYLSGDSQDVVQVYFGNSPKGSLLIKKIDGVTSEPLADVEFFITDSSGAVLGDANGTFVTDSSGTILIDSIDPGTTIVAKETATVAGYVLDDTAQTAVISAGQTVSLEYRNYPKGSLVITKSDSVTGEPLEGVEFSITTSDGAYVADAEGQISSNGRYFTDSAGQITLTGLDPDTYVVTETATISGYVLDSTPQTVVVNTNDVQTLYFTNAPKGGLVITKSDSVTGEPLKGVEFTITTSSGSYVGNSEGQVTSNGKYYTNSAGQITLTGLDPDTYVVTETATISGYILDSTPQTVVVNTNDVQTLYFTNDPQGGLTIIKSDESSGERIGGVKFEVRQASGAYMGQYTTNSSGVIRITDLDSGWYVVTELEAADGYIADTTPHQVEVKDGQTTTLEVTNHKSSGILIHKIDADTGEGIYGVTFLLYDSNKNPIGQYTSDQSGYVYIDEGLEDGRYYIREIEAADGYIKDDELKTIYLRNGSTTEIEWENTAIRGQIQIIKKSADDNPINGLPAGTLLEGATFQIIDKAGNVVDTITTDSNGRAVSKLLPLSYYTIREISAPDYYAINTTEMTAYLEYEGQIVTFEVTNESVATGVSIFKTGYAEVVAGQPIKYTITNIANTSTIALSSFYWRDTLPSEIYLTQLVTGTYNQQLSYKIVYKTNLSGDSYYTLADNLSTTQNYVLAADPTILGLASNERVTEVMYVFGQVKSGFALVETAYVSGTVLSNLNGGTSFVNTVDVGGLYNSQWIMATSRWATTVYGNITITLPKTGY